MLRGLTENDETQPTPDEIDRWFADRAVPCPACGVLVPFTIVGSEGAEPASIVLTPHFDPHFCKTPDRAPERIAA